MQILITNDDGINARGLEIAIKIAKSIIANKKGKITIIAPSTEKSGVSHSISFVRPSLIQKIGKNKYSLEGTPSDCILAGINFVMKDKKPDLIISGVNMGRNIADEEYLAEIIPAPEFGGSFIHEAAYATYGIDLKYNF